MEQNKKIFVFHEKAFHEDKNIQQLIFNYLKTTVGICLTDQMDTINISYVLWLSAFVFHCWNMIFLPLAILRSWRLFEAFLFGLMKFSKLLNHRGTNDDSDLNSK